MREIDRTHYLRGTKAWKTRNWFVFGGIAFTFVFGFASVLLFPDQVAKVRERTEAEQRMQELKRQKIRDIQQHRREVLAALEENKD
ncbi:hypothetical protein V1264_004822 [Littorina saxatilis]|uniref:Uncharacterized protein n=1 Tax=Littorina saxatilis TaxID=31220 RepID=A0AAN9B2A1_9CAEN